MERAEDVYDEMKISTDKEVLKCLDQSGIFIFRSQIK